MKVTFVSNFLNHHQIPFSKSMYKLIGDKYHFISTTPMDVERKSMGWEFSDIYSFELKAYENKHHFEEAINLINESDVVIIGAASDNFIKERLKNNKLTFKYSERLYKKGLNIRNLPHAFISAYIHHGRFQKYPLYMLCASAYTAVDLSIFRNYKNKVFKWGYFPENKKYDIDWLMKNKKEGVINILWVGRFIDLKHPEYALTVIQRLNQENIQIQLTMIGDGKNFNSIKKIEKSMRLKNQVKFLNLMPVYKVRKYMEKSNIYLFTSDFNEGWGAVLNEAMNSGCAVVASHAIGSVPFLIKNRYNGLIYENNNIDDLYEKVKLLVHNKKLCEKLGKNAYLTIKNNWNAEVAANRFIKLSGYLLHGKVYEYSDGPCSKANIIKNNWFSREEKI